MTETCKWLGNHTNLKLPQLFAKAVTCFIRVLEKFSFQVATSQVHHVEDKNDFIESKNPAAKNNKYVKPQKKPQKNR